MPAPILPEPRVGRVRAPDGDGFPTDADAVPSWTVVDDLIGSRWTFDAGGGS